MSEQHSDHIACVCSLGGQFKESAPQPPQTQRLVRDESTLGVEDNPERRPSREPAALDSMPETELVEDSHDLASVEGSVAIIPQDGVEVVDVGRQDGSKNAD